jgi:hypothetical protein
LCRTAIATGDQSSTRFPKIQMSGIGVGGIDVVIRIGQ